MTVTAIQQHQGATLSTLDAETMQHLVAGGDCSRLSPAQKVAYYTARCEAAGLDPRAQPFAFMKLNGKEVLYAQKAATDQLAAKHGLRTTIVSQATEDGIRVVTVRVEAKDGRVTEEIGALPIAGLKGEALSNALMKCVTKAKRRAVLSICGLGMLDETEVETIPQEHRPPMRAEPAPALPANVAAAAEVLGATVVPNDPPITVDLLWQAAKDDHGDGAKLEWTKAATRIFGKVPAPNDAKSWTQENLRKMEKELFGGPLKPDADSSIPF